jgi:hypothetical protein
MVGSGQKSSGFSALPMKKKDGPDSQWKMLIALSKEFP